MKWTWFGRIHRYLYERTGGRIGHKLAGLPMLLLTTVGRRSGVPRTTPLTYMPDGDRFVIVGSNNGLDVDPAWWFNLRVKADARIQVGADVLDVRCALATPEERARLWPELKSFNRAYVGYERRTAREIPVVVLTRR